MPTEDEVIEAIKTVFDPEIPVNIYDLGLIYDIRFINQAQIEVDMTLTSPNCPVAESMPQEVKWKINRLPGILTTKVNIVFDPPWTKDMMSTEAMLELGLL
ncbi:MAG: iron-sulfur cluster assembly protein [Crocinitomicaceae bacterium]